MKALRFREFGLPSVLRIEEIPRPEPRDGEALTTTKICDPGMSDARKNGRLSHFRPEHLKGRLAGNPATG